MNADGSATLDVESEASGFIKTDELREFERLRERLGVAQVTLHCHPLAAVWTAD